MRKIPKKRNPMARVVRTLRPKVKSSKKIYKRARRKAQKDD